MSGNMTSVLKVSNGGNVARLNVQLLKRTTFKAALLNKALSIQEYLH
jgi:hypothetical protein